MIRSLAVALGLFGAVYAHSASATVYEYSYQGQPWIWKGEIVGPGLEWVLSIDEAFLPSGTLANVTLHFETESSNEGGWCSYENRNCFKYTVRSATSTYTEQRGDSEIQSYDRWGWVPFLEFDGDLGDFIAGYVHHWSIFSVSFDDAKMVSGWGGGQMNGGDNDSYTGPRGDGIDYGGDSIGGGAWTRISPAPYVPPIPPAVPLPASGLGLLAALGGLLTLMKTRRRNFTRA